MFRTNILRRYALHLVSLGVALVVLVLHEPMMLSSTLTSVGLLVFVEQQQVASQTAIAPVLFQAEHLLRQAVWWDPTNANARRGLGLALAAQGREDEAMATWQSVVGMGHEFIQRGEHARNVGHYEDALMWYNRATVLDPMLGDTWYYAGLAHEGLGHWQQALGAYEQAVEVGAFQSVAQSDLYYRMGVIYQRRLPHSQLDKALAAYDVAINLNDFSTDLEAADSHYRRGSIYDRLGRAPRDLVAEYRQAVALNPRHKWAHLRLGYALYRAYKDVASAKRELEEALSLWPNDKSRKWPYRFLGDIYGDAGLVEQAIDAYQTALSLDPGDEHVKEAFDDLVADTRSR